MKNRTSYHLTELKKELRNRAVKETNEELRRDFWRLYFKVVHAESEVRELVMDAEIRRLLEIALAYGMLPDNLQDEIDKLEDNTEEDKQPPVDDDLDDDDIPPRQTSFLD